MAKNRTRKPGSDPKGSVSVGRASPELGPVASERPGAEPVTTNQGVIIADNRNSLKGGERGPSLLEDFILREKITHFDHERIPERIVHARGSAAHGTFRAYKSFADLTMASFLAEKDKETPVFARFSTVAGGAGSADLARDVRGFAVKFYTDEGNYDLVGNNIPVFFIQDAMRFPDLIHAVKPEPHKGLPQAQSAHDTFWDFVSLMPESFHMLMWVMSDRAIPRSLRTIEGFGVHTFRFVNAAGESRLVKLHWRPTIGSFSVVWDEALKINGADPDYHRRDLWEAIDRGNFPVWVLSAQLFTEEEAERFGFDVLDATKLIPEELVPLTPLGEMTLNRNPANFFAETEQVAFHPGNLVPGIDVTNDPLLQGRLFSYIDTQLIRLGGPNFHQIPVNQPKCPMRNFQRDGHMRMTVDGGQVAYEPNSLDPNAPAQDPDRGYRHFPDANHGPKLRARASSFQEYHAQARLFWLSQTGIERSHIVGAFTFELSKVTVAAIRDRMVGHLADIHPDLGARVAAALGLKSPPQTRGVDVKDLPASPALSLVAKAPRSIKTRQIGCLVADGVAAGRIAALRKALAAEGASLKIVALKIGGFKSAEGKLVPADEMVRGGPSVLYDAAILLGGENPPPEFLQEAAARNFAGDAFRHLKAIACDAGGVRLLAAAGIGPDDFDEGVVELSGSGDRLASFIEAARQHRIWPREARVMAKV